MCDEAEAACLMVSSKRGSKETRGSGDKRYSKMCSSNLLPPARPHILITQSAVNSLLGYPMDEVSALVIHSPLLSTTNWEPLGERLVANCNSSSSGTRMDPMAKKTKAQIS